MKIPDWLLDVVSSTRRRLRRMPPEDMLRWWDIAGSEMSKAMAEYVRTRSPEALAEVERGLGMTVAMVEELKRRS